MSGRGAMELVADGAALAGRVAALLEDSVQRAAMGRSAAGYAGGQARVLQDTLAVLSPYLDRLGGGPAPAAVAPPVRSGRSP